MRAPFIVAFPHHARALLLGAVLALGVVLRLADLDRVPPGFNQDEACTGYEAYSVLTTGRDHHGNSLALVFQGFNDDRMPAFGYSLVPLEALLGLSPWVVRLGAALWGISDLVALALIGALMMGWTGAAAAVAIAAVSPWHLPLSRFGHDAITAPVVATWAVLCFLIAIRRRDSNWLIASAAVFGLSLYTYAIAKAFTPLMAPFLVLTYWREVRAMRGRAMAAAAVLVVIALPVAWLTWRQSAEMQARFNQLSVLNQGGTGLDLARNFGRALLSHFSRSFLFVRGDWYVVNHPPGFGQLLPAQAAMVVLGLGSLMDARYRKFAVVLLGWLAAAAVPGALTVYAPHALRDSIAMEPWTLLSALGIVYLLELPIWRRAARLVLASALMALFAFEGARFVTFYFRDYPQIAARDFQYGIKQAMEAVKRLDADHRPVVITPSINQPYIYVLFFKLCRPEVFQRARVVQVPMLFGPVLAFDRYLFADPRAAFAALPHGVFVFTGSDATPVPPAVTVRYPDGSIAYKVVVK